MFDFNQRMNHPLDNQIGFSAKEAKLNGSYYMGASPDAHPQPHLGETLFRDEYVG